MADPAKLLPEGPREKYVALKELAADRNAVSRRAVDEMEDARTALHNAEINLTLYSRNPRQTNEEVARLEGRIAEAKSDLRRIGESREARWKRSQPIGTLVARIDQYLVSTDPRSITLFTGSLPKRSKVPPNDAVAATRREIEELTVRLAEIDDAPLPVAEIKARAVALVKDLAEAGAPEIDALLAGGSEIRWPSSMALVGDRAMELTNVPAILAWAIPDVISARIVAMIEVESPDQSGAVASKDRPKLKAQTEEALLLANRVEEAAITEAAMGGLEIERRGEASVLAVLGIVGPAPRD